MRFLRPAGLADTPLANAFLKLAQLPEPPPDSGEVPQEEVPNQPPPIKQPILHALKSVGGSALAFGAGTAAGYGAMMGAERLLKPGPTASRVLRHPVAPILGGLMGVALQQYKSREQQELRRAFEAYKNQRSGAD